ncbi:MAG: sulfotransferase [Flavobacteriales bacterium]|nr:sulfotransferase [Flavobacteriales bacterium]|tara:strand:+ start:339 stop:1121 length:783 start_codon:yes stop_codon:yes gene_type:complete
MVMRLVRFINRFFKYLIGLLFISKNDVLLVSFPKSGNTWVRFYFFNLIIQKYSLEKEISFFNLNFYLPELGNSKLNKKWNYTKIPRVVKTHIKKSFFIPNFKAILLIRHPLDVMVSYYNFEKNKTNSSFKGSFSDFIRNNKYGLEAWCKHYLSWKDKSVMLIKYENLKSDENKQFMRINNYFKIEIEKNKFKKAVEQSSAEFISKIEIKEKKLQTFKNVNKNFQFVRSGEINQYLSYFNNNDMQFAKNIFEKYKIHEYEI